MKYLEFINSELQRQVASQKELVIFGQNITAGSCLGGLTRNLKMAEGGLALNTQNSENLLTSVGLGLMTGDVSSVFFMKQLDFLLLGLDHLVNTYNFIRVINHEASFTIFPVVVDVGYQGMQSSLNNLGDICALARVPGYTITNTYDAEKIIQSRLVAPGLRIIAVSQRLFKEDILVYKDVVFEDRECRLFQYTEGTDVTVVCFNYSLPKGEELRKKFEARGLTASLFSVNAAVPVDWDRIVADVTHTGRVVLMDDSKCWNLSCHHLLAELHRKCGQFKSAMVTREFSEKWFWPNSEEFIVDSDRIVDEI